MGFFGKIGNDIACLRGSWRALRYTSPIAKNPTRVLPDLIDGLAQRFGDKPALISGRETLTYRGLAERANRYSRWALANGVNKGDVICLLMPNRPEYMALWLGITHMGGVVALLNTNLTGRSLAHCIEIVRPKHLICAAELMPTLASATGYIERPPRIWTHGDHDGPFDRVDTGIAFLDGSPLSTAERRPLSIEDKALFIYTSGTTGMPKAANINHYRLMLASYGFAAVTNAKRSDRVYDCLPMYHTAGGVVATGAMLVMGGSVVIREKFSARDFWDDIVRYDCTLVEYIGELCRYLVHSPPQPNETKHRLRLAFGNGLRPDIWDAFKTRFKIPRIGEFYSATEGNVTLLNFDGMVGAVGRIPRFMESHFPITVVKFDVETETPVRNAEGFCIACDPDEVGETVGRIVSDPSAPTNRFEGYADHRQDEAKILHDVFAKGDAWFRTGDLMRKDKRGYFYFVDRIGDTFRWKGENVSTTEVSEAICLCPGIAEANAYGVHVPGRDGRAGMAAIVFERDVDLQALRSHLAARLPPYARPVFLRVRGEIEVTSTFKAKKAELMKQGFNPEIIGDTLYFDDPQTQAYVALDGALYDRIVSGELKF